MPELSVTPDKYVPHRYAGASGDFNPIHIDPEFAKAVGLPGNILHGLYSMAQVARAATQAGGRRPALAEAPVGPVPRHGAARGGDPGHRHRARGRGDRVVIDTVAEQDGNQIIRNAEAELELPLQAAPGRPGAPRKIRRCSPTDSSCCSRSSSRATSSWASRSGSRWLSEQPDLEWSPSTIRYELADARGARATSTIRTPPPAASRPTRATATTSTRCCSEGPLPAAERDRFELELSTMRREVDAAMRATTETLSQVTDLLAAVSAPPLHTATIKHVEVLLLQQQVALVVVITSTGAVTKRAFTFDEPLDPGLADWAASYLNERLAGMDLGALTLQSKLDSPELSHHGAGLPRDARARLLRPRRHDRADGLRRRRRAPAGGPQLRGPRPGERPDADAGAARDAAVGAALGARRADASTCASGTRTRRRSCARRASSPRTTASATARSAPSA